MKTSFYSEPGLAGTYSREEVLAILENAWRGRESPVMFPHLATPESVNVQFDRHVDTPLFIGRFTVPTTPEHIEWCSTCKGTEIYSNLGQCLIGLVCSSINEKRDD